MRLWFRRAPRVRVLRRTRDRWKPALPLLHWSRSEAWLLRHAYEGTICFGATGSGKSTGSGEALGTGLLQIGAAGLVLTAKPDETRVWERYCRKTGRTTDLLIFGPDHPWRFNFLDYELTRAGRGAGLTENIVNLFSTVLELAGRDTGSGTGREDEGYWRRAMRQLVRNLVDVLVLGTGSVSIPDLYQLVVSAPTSREQMRSEEWRAGSFCFHCLCEAERRSKTPQEQRDLALVADYLLVEFPALSEKTRSIVVSTFTSLIDVLNRGILRELFCGETNLTPEATQAGHVVVLDLPLKEYGEVGLIAQTIFKYCWQRSIERRDVRFSPRPQFLWIDEAQNFVTAGSDMQFQATARSARVASVYLVQNVSSVVAALGGQQQGKAEADAILGNLNLKIFHANGDPLTNEYAANLIGRTKQMLFNTNSSYQPQDWPASLFGSGGSQTSAGMNETWEYEIQPAEFATLRTGGRENKWKVGAVVYQSGRTFSDTGRNWRFHTFMQKR